MDAGVLCDTDNGTDSAQSPGTIVVALKYGNVILAQLLQFDALRVWWRLPIWLVCHTVRSGFLHWRV